MGITFVTPESVRLPLSDGDYILIRRRLSTGERDDMLSMMLPYVTPGQTAQINSKDARQIAVATYLLGWSAAAPMSPDLPVQERIDTLRTLDPAAFDEIEAAITAHNAREDAARKNGQGSVITSAPSSASAA